MKIRPSLIVAMLLLCNGLSSTLSAQTRAAASIHFSILKESNGRPVRNAGVVLHPVKKDGKQERGGLELKTDADGNASYDGVPYGKLRIQVLAPGFQTYGEDFEVNQPSLDITVKLKRPSGQYSIYDEHSEKDKGQARDSEKPN
jgi:hypothetical protein